MSSDYLDGMNEGELELYNLCKRLESNSFKVIPNVMLEKNKKGSNQIDLMVVCNKGLFVYEMKDFRGWIFGNENNKEWKQVLVNGKSSTKYSFRNPVKQNDNHIKTIKKLLTELGYNIPIYNVVVFGKNATLKNVEASSDVIILDQSTMVIDKYPELLISDEKLNDIADVLMAMNVTDELQREEHIVYASSFQNNNNNEETIIAVDNDPETNVPSPSSQNSSDTYVTKGGRYVYEEKVDRRDKKKKNDIFTTKLTKLNKLISVLLLLIFLYIIDLGFVSFILAVAIISVALKIQTKKYVPWIMILAVMMLPVFYVSGLLSSDISKTIYEAPVVNVQKVAPVVEDNNSSTKSDTNMWVTKKEEVSNPVEVKEADVLEVIDNTEELNVEPVEEAVSSGEDKIIEVVQVNNSEKIFIGSSMEQVNLLLGLPDEIKGQRNNIYVYQTSTIYFDEQNNVLGFNNEKGQLDHVLPIQTVNNHSLFIGDTKAEVLAKTGAPTEIKYNNINVWFIETSTLTFDLDEVLISYDNSRGYLDDYLPLQNNNNESFFIGNTEEEVIRIVGPPTKILAIHSYSWYYDNDRINFDDNGIVVGYSSSTNNLKGLLPERSDFNNTLFIGATKEEALAIFGAPSDINSIYPNKWEYGIDKLYFDESGLLSGYDNGYNHFTNGLPQGDSGSDTFFIGSTKEEVLAIMGAPSEISSGYPDRWEYGIDVLNFDTGGLLVGYKNGYSHFTSGLPQANNSSDTFSVGDDKLVVLDVMGAPSEVKVGYSDYWYYSSAKVIFEGDLVVGWDDRRGTLKVLE